MKGRPSGRPFFILGVETIHKQMRNGYIEPSELIAGKGS